MKLQSYKIKILRDRSLWKLAQTEDGRKSLIHRANLALAAAAKFQKALRAGTWTDRHGVTHALSQIARKKLPVMMLKLIKFADRNLTAAGK